MDKIDINMLIQLGEKIIASGQIIDDTNKLAPKLVPRPSFDDFLGDKESFAIKAAKSFIDLTSPHNLMVIYGGDKRVRQQFLITIYHETILQNQDKDIAFAGAETLAQIESFIDEKSDILIISEIQEWVLDSAKLFELLQIYMSSREKKLLLISDRHPSGLTNIDEKCKSVLQTFLIVDLQS